MWNCRNCLSFTKRFQKQGLIFILLSVTAGYLLTQSHISMLNFKISNPKPIADVNEVYADLLEMTTFDFISRYHNSNRTICQIPILDPFDPAIVGFTSRQPRIQCRKLQPGLFYLDNARLWLNRTELELAEIVTDSESCHYRCIEKTSMSDFGFSNGSWINISFIDQPTSEMLCDIVHVKCSFVAKLANKTKAYENIFYQIVPKHKKSAKISETNSTYTGTVSTAIPTKGLIFSGDSANGAAEFQPTPKKQFVSQPPNVIVLVIDSMSRSHFIRALPKTYKFLMEEYGAIDFTGMMKVGLNSNPNMVAALTGVPVHATKELPTGQKGPFDKWPLDWYNFSRHGYVTLYGEDMQRVGLFQSYGRKGFLHQPTDHYMRPMMEAIRLLSLHRGATKYCKGNIPTHKLLSDSILKLFQAYADSQPKYAHVHVSDISHDIVSAVTSADDDLLEFLQAFKSHLCNTFFFMMGDHGFRFGKIIQSHLGQQEAAMPFLSITVPEWFRLNHPIYYESLKQNSKHKLISMFDIHATKMTILQQDWMATSETTGTPIPPKSEHVSASLVHSINGGQSLFLPISYNRTCQQAWIPEEFCVCETQEEIVKVDHPKAMLAAYSLVSHLNDIVQSAYTDKRCVQLELAQILSATVIVPSDKTEIYVGSHQTPWTQLPDFTIIFNIMISVYPSEAIFQTKVQYFIVANSFKVFGLVRRVNLYNNQSHCVSGDMLNYCYCQDQNL